MDRIIRLYPRYWQLLQLRNLADGDCSLLDTQYWRDLQTWFNLAWIDPNWLEKDPALKAIVEKGRLFGQQDVDTVVSKHFEIMKQVLPTYRTMQETGQIEVSTSPYFHPILPALINTDSAKRASPGMSLPDLNFSHPEDAVEQLRLAVESHERCFGEKPTGLWPSEGAVSREVLELVAGMGNFKWLASDEGILALSLGQWVYRDPYGHVTNPRMLYRPYVGTNGLSMVFRDHLLSDRIGFVYRNMPGCDAANDLMHRLHKIRENLSDDENPYLVSIILDGENCWEGYEHNGDVFLRQLYALLSSDPNIKTVTVSEFLHRFPPSQSLPAVHTGSWINSNLETWIGEPPQNEAWEYLTTARDRLIEWQNEYPLADYETLEKAWREIYIAEGSDWFWWYYSRNDPAGHTLFDEAFRTHLGNIYRLMGVPSPSWLNRSILSVVTSAISRPPSGYVSPRLSIEPVVSVEWSPAGYLDPEVSGGGAMQMANFIIKRLYYGYNPADVFFRLELNEHPASVLTGLYLKTSSSENRVNQQTRFGGTNSDIELPDISFDCELMFESPNPGVQMSFAEGRETWHPIKTLHSVAVGQRSIEISVPLSDLSLKLGDSLSLVVVVARSGVILEALPSSGHLSFNLRAMT